MSDGLHAPLRSRRRSRRSTAIACGVSLLIAGVLAPSRGTSAPPSRDAKLRSLLSTLVATAKAPGGVLLVRTPTGTWRASVGAAQLRPERPLQVTDRFRVASVTKTFTAALVLRLVSEGALSLDDTVERWLPGRLPNGAGSAITIRALLGHRSGLVNEGDDLGPITVAGPPNSFHYANANYQLLGAVVEAATGATFADELASRILEPLDLTRTELAAPADVPPGLVHGYSPAPARPGGPRLDLTTVPYLAPAPAGGLVSTAADLARFASALVSGQVVPSDLLALMRTPGSVAGYPTAGYTAYGLGLMRFPSPCGAAWGHRGRTPGYTSYVLFSANGRRTAVALLNDGTLPDTLALKVDKVVADALCT
jgi:D-alanyl-D-alanine carboxypeptidase